MLPTATLKRTIDVNRLARPDQSLLWCSCAAGFLVCRLMIATECERTGLQKRKNKMEGQCLTLALWSWNGAEWDYVVKRMVCYPELVLKNLTNATNAQTEVDRDTFVCPLQQLPLQQDSPGLRKVIGALSTRRPTDYDHEFTYWMAIKVKWVAISWQSPPPTPHPRSHHNLYQGDTEVTTINISLPSTPCNLRNSKIDAVFGANTPNVPKRLDGHGLSSHTHPPTHTQTHTHTPHIHTHTHTHRH